MMRFLLLCLVAAILTACGGGGSTKFRSADPVFGYYKVGNPYKIKGKTYRPKVDYNYSEVGIASWYGRQFHGKKTANGAIFNMNKVSAAHRTLPLPSYVMVENLENGKKLKILVNDRGPFYNNRIIDLSREAAKQLGVFSRGTARVRVTILAEESALLATRMQSRRLRQNKHDKSIIAKAAPVESVTFEDLPAIGDGSSFVSSASAATIDSDSNSLSNETPGERQRNRVYIQVGAYENYLNALDARLKVRSVGKVELWQTETQPPLFRVRIGPYANVSDAEDSLFHVADKGFKDARIVITKDN